jgi:hypothetical protein
MGGGFVGRGFMVSCSRLPTLKNYAERRVNDAKRKK